MLTIENFMKAVDYKINEGGAYGWDCYGRSAFALDSNRQNGSMTIIYDTKNQKVYEISCCDYTNNKCFRWIDPKYLRKHILESKRKGHRFEQAWDHIFFVAVDEKKIIKECKKVSKYV